MRKKSKTTISYLFDLCLRVIIKMAKTKAKRVPYRDFNPRDRYSIETWRKVKSLFNQGFKRAQIEDQMKIKLHKRTFNQNMKKNYDVPDVNSRKLNRSNKRTVICRTKIINTNRFEFWREQRSECCTC